jgi:hypothetical protein
LQKILMVSLCAACTIKEAWDFKSLCMLAGL